MLNPTDLMIAIVVPVSVLLCLCLCILLRIRDSRLPLQKTHRDTLRTLEELDYQSRSDPSKEMQGGWNAGDITTVPEEQARRMPEVSLDAEELPSYPATREMAALPAPPRAVTRGMHAPVYVEGGRGWFWARAGGRETEDGRE